MKKPNISGSRDDHHEPLTDEDLREQDASEFWGISDGDHGVSKGSAVITPCADCDDDYDEE